MDITIVLPVSRIDYVYNIFADLEMLDCDSKHTSLLVCVDGDVDLYGKVNDLTRRSKFFEKLCVYRKKGKPDPTHVRKRRQRIADIHNELKEYLKGATYYFLIEDDTKLPSNALQKLTTLYSQYPTAGMVSGLQLGRHGFLHVGAWTVDDVYQPSLIESIPFDRKTRSVDAAGLYCCLVKADRYEAHTFKPFQDILGPDTDFGIELRRQGYQNYVDGSLLCGHRVQNGVIEFHNSDIVTVRFDKTDDPNVRFNWHLTTNVQLTIGNE